MREYVELAHRTLKSGTMNPGTVSAAELIDSLHDVDHVTEQMDRLKKALIYGKDIGEVDGPDCTELLSNMDADTFHAILGIFTEAGELMQAVMKVLLEGKKLDAVNLREELGDLLWYQAVLSRCIGTTFEKAGEINIAKLRARFPDKFSGELAINRDVAHERTILEHEA